jgi:hypothetical protein
MWTQHYPHSEALGLPTTPDKPSPRKKKRKHLTDLFSALFLFLKFPRFQNVTE